MPDYIDIHSHVNFEAFKDDRDEVVKRALDNKTWMINVGTQMDTSKSAIALAEKYERGVYAIVGLHPVHTDKSYHDEKELGAGGKEFTSRGETFDLTIYRKMLENPKVVGVGECGLDYYRIKNYELARPYRTDSDTFGRGIMNEDEGTLRQKEIFKKHIELAIETNKPLMLHIRNGSNRSAYKEAFEILNSYFKIHNSRLRGDVHFFAGEWEDAKRFLDIGFSLSFTGVITFARNYDDVIRKIPLESIMSETDCPYITPVPHRGKRNEPLFVSEVVKKIAETKNIPLETVKKQLVANAMKLFSLS